MSEFKAYQDCKEAWVIAMARKYLWRHERFKPAVRELFNQATEEETELAKQAYEDFK